MTTALSRREGRSMRSLRLAAMIGALMLALGLSTSSAHAADNLSCQTAHVPVTVPGTSDAYIYGKLCVRPGTRPSTVQLLVPGSTNTSAYFDFPLQPQRYSYVKQATNTGYATFAIDRIGSGQSTRPPSTQITLDVGADTLHEVISALRAGKVGDRAFSRVVYVGNSLGSIYGWVEASRYSDVDGFVLTDMTHAIKPSFLPIVSGTYYPATEDPKFATSGFDPGYMTTNPGTRPMQFFYTPGASSRVIDLDEQLKDTVSGTEFGEAVGLITSPPADTAPSRAIKVPTLLVVGDHDQFFCGAPDGIDCTPRTILSGEAPYYSSEARLSAIVAADSGHSIQLHYSAPHTTDRILGWIASRVPRH